MALTVPVEEIVANSKNPLLGKHESWGRVRLGDIAEIQNGFPFKSSQFTKHDGTPLVRIRDVSAGTTDTNYVGDYDPAFLVGRGDLLIGMDGDFHCSRWRGPKALLNQRVCRVTLKSDVYHPRLLDYALPGYLQAINDVTSSVTVKHLSSRSIADIPLPLPPMDQQQRIVAEIEKQFSRLDEAVANLNRVKANLKRYRAAVLKAAVEGRLVETEAELARREGRTYETGEQLLERILAKRRSCWRGTYREPSRPNTADLPRLPAGWVWATADQITSLITDGEHNTPRRSASGVLLLSARNVYNDGLDLSEVDYIPGEEHARLVKRLAVMRSDVLMSCSGSVGRSCVVPKGLDFSLVRSVAVLRPILVSPQFVSYQIQSPWLQSQIDRKKTQTAQANIFQGKIRQLVFALPPVNEMSRIVAEIERRLSLISVAVDQTAVSTKKGGHLRRSILASCFVRTEVPSK